MLIRCSLFLIILLLPKFAFAENASLPLIDLNRTNDYLEGYIETYEDHTKQLSIGEVLKVDPTQWQIENNRIINHKTNDAIVWLHFKVDARDVEGPLESWRLMVQYILLDEIQVYSVTQPDDSILTSFGIYEVVENRSGVFEQNSSIFDLPVKTGIVNEYYVRASTLNSTVIPVLLMTDSELAEWLNWRANYCFFYYGIMVVMLIFYLFLFVRTRLKLYFLLALIIFSSTCYNTLVDGFTVDWVVSNFRFNPFDLVAFFALVNISSTCLFAMGFLDSKHRAPKLHFGFLILIALSAITIVMLPFAAPVTIVRMVVGITVIEGPLLLVSSLWIYFKGYKEVKYLAIGASFHVAFQTIYGWSLEGIIPWVDLSHFYFHIGSGFLATFVSIALLDKFNRYREEKLQFEMASKAQLESLNADLLKSNQLKDEFLSTISHELRTPMNGVLGALELVDRSNLPRQDKSNLTIANKSAEEMVRLVDDLLCFSELNGNEKTRIDVTFFAPDIKHYLLENLQQKADAKGLDFEIDIGNCEEQWINSDFDKLKSILFHFVDNGIKFTEKGKVKVEVDCRKQNENNAEMEVVISDTGIGIEQDKLETLFKAFQQADGSFSRNFGGLGIGMAICAKMVDSLEGTIKLESKPGVGTIIKVSIPVHLMEAPQGHNFENSVSNLNGQQSLRLKALIVEDNVVNQKVLAGMLKKLNVETEVACNGLEGVELCRQHKFDIICMDCQMPVMDGFESTIKIRQECSENSHVPIIAVTANATAKDKRNCLASGMNDFMKKPIKKDDIENMLNKYVYSNFAKDNEEKITQIQ